MCNKTLTLLNLEGNRLGPEGGVAIAEALHRNNSLVDLNIENNRRDCVCAHRLEEDGGGRARGGGSINISNTSNTCTVGTHLEVGDISIVTPA